ncbi:MAG TPA: polysaccharide deacetylase family protein [Candidatus Binatia bacterium]|nr:polysaccharide deacetylase family protein [Candidatus Binatia bacterium]
MSVPHGIMFHHFHGNRHAVTQGSITAQDFEDILCVLGPERFLHPSEWLARLDAGALRPEDLCLTFDDGLMSQYDVALPVMGRYGLKAFWFVYSTVFEGGIGRFEIYRAFRSRFFGTVDVFYADFFDTVRRELDIDVQRAVRADDIDGIRRDYPFYSVSDVQFRLLRDRVLGPERFDRVMEILIAERHITLEELAENLWMTPRHVVDLAAGGHHIGLHSYSHPTSLADLSRAEQHEEYARNLAHLHGLCGTRPAAVAHPVNSYNDATLEVLRELGIRCGFRANTAPCKAGEPLNASTLELAREDHANIINRLRAMETSKSENQHA